MTDNNTRLPREIWRVFPLNDRYQISNLGNCRVTETKRPLKYSINNKGYQIFPIRNTQNGSERGWILAAHAVLITFRTREGRPLGLESDHIDNDKTNNTLKNLEWVTHKENIRRAVASGRFHFPDRKPTQNKAVRCIINGVHLSYKSISDAARISGFDRRTIVRQLRTPTKNSIAGIWVFAE
jgi:hypothetical protein